MNRAIVRGVLTGLVVGSAVLLAGGAGNIVVAGLAAVSAMVFGDLVRRSSLEAEAGDPTDLATAVGFVAVILAAAVDAGGTSGLPESSGSFAARIGGLTLLALGVALRTWVLRAMGPNFSVRLSVRPGQELVDRGPFRWVRHPNYAGLLAVAIGTSLVFESLLALAATFVVWLPLVVLRIAREERMLIAKFGAAYEDYQRRTWKLLPGII